MPRWPVQQYVGELPSPPCSLDLWFAPDVEELSMLYEDEGDGLAHRYGAYLLHTFTCRTEKNRLFLTHRRTGQYRPQRPCFTLRLHALPTETTPTLLVDGQSMPLEWANRVACAEIPIDFREVLLSL